MKTIIYNKLNEKIISDWEKLWRSSPFANVVNSPAWFLAAYEVFQYRQIVMIAVYDDNNALISVAGFVKTKQFGIPVYSVPAQEFVDKHSILTDFNNDKATMILISEIAKLGNVYFTAFRENVLLTVSKNIKQIKAFKGDVSAYVDYSKGQYGDLSLRKRNSILNRVKKSPEKLEVIHFTDNHKDPLEIVFNIEENSSKLRNGKGVFDRSDARDFFKLLSKYIPENVMTTILLYGQKPIAYSIGFICNKEFCGNQKAHLPEFNYYNPGKLLAMNLMDKMREDKLPEFELGRGYDRFKMDFTDDTRNLYNLIISKNIFIRFYIYLVFYLREKTYNLIIKHQKLYIKYRNLKKKFFIQNAQLNYNH